MTKNRIEKYFKRHGRYPRFERPAKDLFCLLAPGYIRLNRRRGEIYIPRDELIELLRWLVPLVRDNPAASFDPTEAMDRYLEQEADLHRELRRQKKESRALLLRQHRAQRGRGRRKRRRSAEED